MSADEYRANAKEMLLKGFAAFDPEERQEYLRLATAWNAMAQGAAAFEQAAPAANEDDETPGRDSGSEPDRHSA
jgi:hypothetical protein